jgi:hypothetical protein
MSQATQPDFQHVLELIESMSPEDQETLIELIRHRLVEWRRGEIAQNAAETLQAVREGRAGYGTVKDLERELPLSVP